MYRFVLKYYNKYEVYMVYCTNKIFGELKIVEWSYSPAANYYTSLFVVKIMLGPFV